MSNLVAITDPVTQREYRVHPFIAECGEWFAQDRAGLRRQLPDIHAFERDLARLTSVHSTPVPEPVFVEGAANA